jgi:DNA-directed RNA polymerase specialized sigma24 family protein
MGITAMSDGSVTRWIGPLSQGDEEAAQRLWGEYFARLVALARGRLRGAARRAADEEDIALSAFDSFCRGAERGRFPRLSDRDDLWQMLVVITVRKAIDLTRREGRQSRGSGRVRALSELEGDDVDRVLGSEPSPALAAQVAEECRRRLGMLGDEALRSIALWKMEGFTNEEIAGKLGCVRFTVDRKLQTIRSIWSEEESS